eukprot:gene1944-3771_t
MHQYSDVELLESTLSACSSCDEAVRKRAAFDIKAHVESAARELSLESFANFENELYQSIFAFVHSDQLPEKMGGIEVIRALINCASAAVETKAIKFANTLGYALRHNTDFELIALVADALGHMAKYSPISHVDYVECELDRSLEWLRGVNIPHRRFAACAVLQQLAENAPTIFFVRIHEFFELVWGSLRDFNEDIRFAAGKALNACLSVLKQRTYHLQWYCNIYEQTLIGFRDNSSESLHASLLVIRELLKHTGDFMIPRFKEICRAVMSVNHHRNRSVRAAIIQLLPELAEFCTVSFARAHLNESVEKLIRCARSTDLRAQALLSIGKLCRALGKHLVDYPCLVEDLLTVVREVLILGVKKPNTNQTNTTGPSAIPEALFCISDMVQALGKPFHDRVLELLDAMLLSGLTQELIDTLAVISANMPSQQSVFQSRLLEEVTKVLGGGDVDRVKKNEMMSTVAPVTSKAAVVISRKGQRLSSLSSFESFTSGPSVLARVSEAQVAEAVHMNPELVLLSLRTLGTLSTPSATLLPLLQRSVAPYLAAEDENIRSEAAMTCLRLIAAPTEPFRARGPTAMATENILSRLLDCAVSDPSQNVRNTVLKYLVQKGDFDRFLCQTHHVDTIMFLLSDESFEIRGGALSVLGRLANLNPSVVLPRLRQVLLHLISEIRNSADTRQKEEAALMLCNFLRAPSLHRIVKPFMGTLIKSLPISSDVRLTTAGLEALGELCMVMRQETMPFTDQLLPILISNMHDKSSLRKQEMAVRTLGQLVSATGHVVRPYLQYPQLLPWALDLLVTNSANSPWSLRKEVLRTLGLLGALEPHKYHMIIQHLQEHVKGSTRTENIIATGGASSYNQDNNNNVLGGVGGHMQTIQQVTTPTHIGNEQAMSLRTSTEWGSTHKAFTESNLDNILLSLGDLVATEVQLDENIAETPAHQVMYEQSVMRTQSVPSQDEEEFRLTPSHEDFYPRVAIAALMRILRDGSLGVHHSSVTQAIMFIFKSMGLRSVPFLDQIIPYLLQIVKRCGPGLRESLLQQLSQLATIVKNHLAPYIAPLFEIISEFWHDHLEHILNLVEEVSLSAGDDFSPFVDRLLNLLLASLVVTKHTHTKPLKTSVHGTQQVTHSFRSLERTLACVDTLRAMLRPHVALVVPALCKLITQLQDLGPETLLWQASTVRTLHRMCAMGGMMECPHIASRAVHTISRAITRSSAMCTEPPAQLFAECTGAICCIARQLGPRFLAFDELVRNAMESGGFSSDPYDVLIRNLKRANRKGCGDLVSRMSDMMKSQYDGWSWVREEEEEIEVPSAFSNDLHRQRQESSYNLQQTPITGGTQKIAVNQQQLQRSWDVEQRTTSEDWNEWLRRFTVELLRESPSPALRSCSGLAQAYGPLARELFHAAFVSCWQELTETYQDSLVRSLQSAFQSKTIPPEILQILLNLAEFMEHDVEPLPIDPSTLAELAQKSHAYAKALHYRELEFLKSPTTCFESLISINKKLDQYDAALGVLKVVQALQKQKANQITLDDSQDGSGSYAVHEAWLAKLGHWEDALSKYQNRMAVDPHDRAAVVGSLKCLDALGRWEEAIRMCSDNMNNLLQEEDTSPMGVLHQQSNQQKGAVIGARAAWSLNEWQIMDTFVSHLPSESVDGLFLRSVLSVHEEDFQSAALHIDQTRKQLDDSLTALLAESYSRAYVPLVMLQQLSELEEIMEYKILLKEAGLARATGKRRSSDGSFSNSNNGGSGGGDSHSHGRDKEVLLHSRGKITQQIDENDDGSEGLCAAQMDALHRKAFLVEKWRRRIRGCRSSGRAAIPVWQHILQVRRMVLSDREDLDTWLDFATLCRRGGNLALSRRVLNMRSEEFSCAACEGLSIEHSIIHRDLDTFAPVDPENIGIDRKIRFAVLRQLWSSGRREHAMFELDHLLHQMDNNTDNELHLNCLLKLGQWKLATLETGVPVDAITRRDILMVYSSATQVQPQSYSAWHEWGLANYRALEETRNIHRNTRHVRMKTPGGGMKGDDQSPSHWSRGAGTTSGSPRSHSETVRPFVVGAAKGLLRAITLGTRRFSSSVTQDMLCVLNIWFRYGHLPDVAAAIESGLSNVHLDNWLGVLPQLIARIHHPEDSARNMLHNLLRRLGAKHAQALIYPLFVALKSPREDRKAAAEILMSSLRQNSSKLVDQALLVSQELIRVAILWQEIWHEALEEASRQFFGDGNVQSMLDTLLPLHQTLEGGATTMLEESFYNTYIAELTEAHECLKLYLRAMNESGRSIPTSGAAPGAQRRRATMGTEEKYVVQAWDSYYSVFKRINQTLPQITSLELQYVSPQLLNAKDLTLAVPGTYCVDGKSVRIQSFNPTVLVIRSKQRPRKIRILGEDGQEFVFLLKGHEDLRQDERAMQLFGLVNALLYHGRGTENHDLDITRYPVMPLSPNTGVVGWVPHCDTLHDLIRDYRDRRKIMLNTEHKLMQQMAPNNLYETLTSIQKLEIFEHALANSTGDDLHKILWYRSETSESWLQRRLRYTRSLAVMSMVGYVLGLGDRHPSNLMLHRDTGKILHIDFGDCFEVAMHRDKFPETIPFRLTRMLVNAMEVSGIEGTFRLTCEKVMSVLRENKDSLIAVLEAFVHDPLISWRLLNPNSANKDNLRGPEGQSHPAPLPVMTATPSSTGENDSTTTNTVTRRERGMSMPQAGGAGAGDNITSASNGLGGYAAGQPKSQGGFKQASRSLAKSASRAPTLPPLMERPEQDHATPVDDTTSAAAVSHINGAEEDNNHDTDSQPKQELGLRGAFASRSLNTNIDDFEARRAEIDAEMRALSPVGETHMAPPVEEERDGNNDAVRGFVPGPEEWMRATTAITTTTGGEMGGGGMGNNPQADELGKSKKSSYGPNLHLTMMNLALSASQQDHGSIVSGAPDASMGTTSSYAFSEARYRSVREKTLQRVLGPEGADAPQEELTEKAVAVIRRVMDKLTGMDFAEGGVGVGGGSASGLSPSAIMQLIQQQGHGPIALDVAEQVDRLIRQASSNENLCLCFFGWCPFW